MYSSLCLKINPLFQSQDDFLCYNADHNSGNNPSYDKYGSIVKDVIIFYYKCCNEQLSDVVADPACGTDRDDVQSGISFQQIHDKKAQYPACKAVEDAEHIAEHKPR